MELYLNVRKVLSILKWKVVQYKYWKFTEPHSKRVFEKIFKIKSLKSSVFERLSTFCVHRSIFFM